MDSAERQCRNEDRQNYLDTENFKFEEVRASKGDERFEMIQKVQECRIELDEGRLQIERRDRDARL